MIKVALLGSTGSIGTQVANVVRRYSDRFELVSLTAHKNARVFLKQVEEFKPRVACITENIEIPDNLKSHTKFFVGENSFIEGVIDECDVVVVALVGFVGIHAVIRAIEKGKKIALANKESLVVGGGIVMPMARERGVEIVPIDSEHSAIWQALNFDKEKEFEKLIITASGGALRDLELKDLDKVSVEETLNHPNWNMGGKITIDCATMVNKGLEVIEAKWLFNTSFDKIDVVIHPESIIHSMVTFKDGSTISQMANPSMELPIQLALTYPERLQGSVKGLDFTKVKKLTFLDVDKKRYPAFDVVVECGKRGGLYPCVVSSANEVAVEAFLNKKIKFTDIYKTIKTCVDNFEDKYELSLKSLIEVDKLTREQAKKLIGE